MNPKVTLEKVKKDILSLNISNLSDYILAVGIIGSLARGESFHERSDIDIVVVVKDDVYNRGNKFLRDFEFRWRNIFSTLFYDKYRRDTTVIFYPIDCIKKIACWKTLGMAAECVLVYDKDGLIGRMFKRICEKAKGAGLERVKVTKQYVWRIKPKLVEPGKIIELSLEGEQF